MARAERNSGRRERVLHGIATFLLFLLPGFMFVGMIAPAAVKVQQEEQEEETASRGWNGPLTFRPLSKQPLLIPRDYSAGFVPELVDIESLFWAASYRAQDWQRISSLPSFPSRKGDTIVLDEVDAYVAPEIFDDALASTLHVDFTPLWDPALFDEIPPFYSTNGERQYDEFGGSSTPELTGSPPVVPEPRTGALLALGLVGIGIEKRRRSRG